MFKIDLSGKNALVTASSKGIGKGIAKVLSLSGAEVIIVSRNENNLRIAAEEIKKFSGRSVNYIVADLTNSDDLDKIVDFIRDKFEHLDIFVFNSGGPRPGRFDELDMDDWENAVRLLLYPAVYLTKRFIGNMKRRGWGRIILSTSIAIKEPVAGLILSNTVRISLAGFIRTLAKEYARFGITVNGIMPGYISTERVIELANKRAMDENRDLNDVIREMEEKIPAGRMGRPEEIGYLVAFLSSDYASYINGAIIPVDGALLNSSL